MRSLRAAAAAGLVGGLFPLGVAVPAACADTPSAVLVVDTEQDGGQYRFCVTLPDGSVTGIELIELAHEQHGLDYRLGYGGNAVCVLAGVGYESDECLKEGPEFWGYWRSDGSGGWEWSSTGGNATTVRDGDVEGWSWGTGNDGSSHPSPPPTTFTSVCGSSTASGGDGGKSGTRNEGAPSESDPGSGGSKSNGAAGTERTGAAPAAKDRARRSTPRQTTAEKREKKARAGSVAAPEESAASEPTSGPAAAEPASLSGEDRSGLPVEGIVAAALAVACAGAALILRRRRAQGP